MSSENQSMHYDLTQTLQRIFYNQIQIIVFTGMGVDSCGFSPWGV